MSTDAPWTLRAADAPSEAALDAYAVGEASPEQRAAIEAWAARDPAHAAVVAERQRGFDSLPMANPQAMLARIALAVEAEGPAEAPPRRVWARLRLPLGLLAVAAAAAVAWLLNPAPPAAPQPETVTAKGGLTLRVVRRRGDAATELVSGDSVQAGDRLRFVVGGGPAGGQLLVAGAETDGTLFAYVPASGRSVPASQLDAEGALPGAAVLDASSGREHAFLVWCEGPITVAELGRADHDRLVAPPGCRTAAFVLHKP